ncbi:J domain-containing protein [Blastomonas sp. AAP53]|uniref:J domain-containing protein n=1 Tax=Blastomonas sp. AAP53 TaxID=1248760 RepID=UPI0002FB66BF|nr:J domain-containing protein [Blastomonas sp. AAP53]
MADGNDQEKHDGTARRRARFHGRVEGTGHRCDWAECAQDGEFRAPPAQDRSHGSRFDGPGRYRWYCLEHIREFNERYNFFAGMTAEEIYDAQRPTSGWDRETRAFAAGAGSSPRWSDFSDPLDAIGARFRQNIKDRAAAQANDRAAAQRGLSVADRSALKTLGLGADANRTTIRQAYSRLVRAYHPDRNGGDRAHEKALQEVIAAYTHLRKLAAFT